MKKNNNNHPSSNPNIPGLVWTGCTSLGIIWGGLMWIVLVGGGEADWVENVINPLTITFLGVAVVSWMHVVIHKVRTLGRVRNYHWGPAFLEYLSERSSLVTRAMKTCAIILILLMILTYILPSSRIDDSLMICLSVIYAYQAWTTWKQWDRWEEI